MQPSNNNDKFLIIKNIKNFILSLEKLLITFPKKDMFTKNMVYEDALEVLELVSKANYDTRVEIKKTYQIEALAKINKIDFQICVAHVNHMIREEAKEDEKYVKNYCEKNGIEFYSKSIDVQKIANNKKIGTEEAGRNARYEFFDEILEKENANKIAIAHNKNDKIETIIMNMLRGSGISGLKGIEPKRENKYIRPLIETERTSIEEYCEEKNLRPRIDKTNFINEMQLPK